MASVLDILKQSCIGITREELAEKAVLEGINSPFIEVEALISKGLARADESPAPTRYKATKLAFEA